MKRERRYPPSPYAPHSAATAAYRDGWDLGWKHYATLRAKVLDHEAGLTGPHRHGYRDGVIARYMFEEKQKVHEARARRAEIAIQRERERYAAASEAPY